jgi:hypothetical protein
MTITELIKHLSDILSESGNINIYTNTKEDKWNSLFTEKLESNNRCYQYEIVWK